MVVKSVYVGCHADLCIRVHKFCFRDEACKVFCQDSLYVAAVDLDFCLDAGLAIV